MWDLKVCRACLATGVKLYHINGNNFRISYETLTGLQLSGVDEMLLNVCVECATLLKKYTTFRKKCRRAHFSLKQILGAKIEPTEIYFKTFDRSKLNLTSQIGPCALPQKLITISDSKPCYGNFKPSKSRGIYNITTFEIPQLTVTLRKKVNLVKSKSVTAREKPMEAMAESSQVSGHVKKVERFVEPSAVNEMVKVEVVDYDYYDKSGAVESSFEDRDIKPMIDLNTYGVLATNSQVKTEKDTICATGNKDTRGKEEIANTVHNDVIDTHDEAIGETSKCKVKSESKSQLQSVRGEKTQNECNFAVITFLNPLEQRDEMEKRKTSPNYIYATYKCEMCYRGYLDAKTFLTHQLKHDVTVSGSFECDLCHVRFLNRKGLVTHINNNHGRRFSCQLCPFVCFNRTQALMHNRWHTGVTFSCKECGEIFKKRSSHLSHQRVKHPSQYKCSLCFNTFVSEAGVTAHQRLVHKDPSPIQKPDPQVTVSSDSYCTTCSVQFESVPAYTKHLLNEPGHCTSTIINGCAQCGESFESEAELKEHSKSHHQPMKCTSCNLIMIDRQQYLAHRRTAHPSLKTLMCESCGQSVTSHAMLLHHFLIHRGEKPYKCKLCPKAFLLKVNLDQHRRAHCDERPFPCATCGKAFKVKMALERHEMIHSGVKPYKCTICGKAYNQSTTLKLHINAVHNKIPWPLSKKKQERRAQLANKRLPP